MAKNDTNLSNNAVIDSERSTIITVGDKEYALLLTTKATKEIGKRYGGLQNLGDKLFEVETDKVTVEVEAIAAGKLTEIKVGAGVTAKVGATVDTAGYTLSVVAFEPIAKPSIIYAAKPGYKLVAVEIVVGNNKDDKMSVNPLYAHLVDTRGFLWAVKLGGRDGKQMDSGDIGKGEKVRGWVAFEIPNDAMPDAIQYGFGNLFSPTNVYSAVQ